MFLVTGGRRIPTAEAGWVWWGATTVITQYTVLDGRTVPRSFWSYYGADPNWSVSLLPSGAGAALTR